MSDTNWQTIHNRLQEAQGKLEASMNLTEEAKGEILRRRARELAREDVQSQADEAPLEVLEFRLAEETYALECLHIDEVYPLKSLTPIPGVPGFVLGIINIRGRIVSVIDLKVFFQLPPKGLNDLTRVIILHKPGFEFGVLAEEVLGTRSIPMEAIQPALPTLTGVRSKYLKGIGTDRLIILDAVKLLGDEKMVINQETGG